MSNLDLNFSFSCLMTLWLFHCQQPKARSTDTSHSSSLQTQHKSPFQFFKNPFFFNSTTDDFCFTTLKLSINSLTFQQYNPKPFCQNSSRMSRFPMNRYDEQRLIQEVHYLHSLWHQGPPRPHPHPHLPIPTHPTPIPLQPSSSTKFKKRKIKNPKKLNKEAIIDSGIEWPCPKPVESPPVTESGWGSFKPQPILQPHLPTDQELANFASNRAHQGALKAVSDYFEYSIDAEEDDEEDDDDEEKGEKSYGFFAKLFEEDGVLREYYEKNGESGGEFSCLVCCGVGKKGWKKRFKDCVALVQHSITIANTRQTHRAYGQVICKILGWDISRLPSIVLTAGYKASESSDKPAEGQGNEDDGGKDGLSNTTDTVNIGSDELSQQKQSFSNENQQENGGGSTALEHNSAIEASVSNAIPETAKENTKNASNCPGRSRCARRKTYKRRWLKEMAKLKEKNIVAESEGLGTEEDGDKDGLSGLSNTTDTVNIGSDELSQQKQSFSNENQQEDGGGSTALEHNSPLEATVSNSIPEMAKENTQGASNGPGRSKAARRRAAKRQCLRETAKIKKDTVAGSEGLGNEDGGRDGLSGLSNTTETVNIGSDELSQQKQFFSNENQQENNGGSTALGHNCPIEASINTDISESAKENTEGASNCPGNEGDGGKNSLSGQSHTTDNVNIGSNEVSQQKEPSGNENQQDNGGGSTVLEQNSTSEVNANRSWEDVSNDKPETAKGNAEGTSNCPEPSPDDMIVANEENNRQKHAVLTETTIVSDKS
ncbi:uncharacterized protein LOC132629101 isoform X2 [Lycium barbarum]|uniref:uncharacterized protein LOC132629101 isoform X2 n=1 Tax=Lycium barbarum TaxID=112863 RepID=UPI00293EEDAC|nr:uncharacterized protein LOC132629101 isoform X2 [Lycium barbarum]